MNQPMTRASTNTSTPKYNNCPPNIEKKALCNPLPLKSRYICRLSTTKSKASRIACGCSTRK